MPSKCENCELFLKLEKEKIQWCKELSLKNINLHKKLTEQQELIMLLKNKLLEKRSNFMSDCAGDVVKDIRNFVENQNFQYDYSLNANIKEKLDEVTEFLNIFNNEREVFEKEIEVNEKYFSDSITYLNGLVDYFRESLFEEFDKSNILKKHFIKKISRLATSSHYVVLNTLKEEGERLNNELKSRYSRTIQKSKEEIERQNLLFSKLRKHNKQLYVQIQQSKVKHEETIAVQEKSIRDLKMTIKRLKEKNDYLHTQLKLEVEGCQNDIYDARKRIKEFKKLGS